MIRRAAAALGAVLLLSGGTGAKAAPPALPSPPVSGDATDAILQVAERVCRPAADTQTDPGVFATEAGYAPEPEAPANLPLGSMGLRTWRAPSPAGRLYVMAGLLPEATTPSTCLVALYDAPAPALAERLGGYLMRLKRGFDVNRALTFSTGEVRMTRYDRRVGDTLHSIMVMETLQPGPGVPTQVVAAFVVDQGWMRHPGRR